MSELQGMKLNVQSEKEFNRIISRYTTVAGLKSINDRRQPERNQLGMYLAMLKKHNGKVIPMVIDELSPNNDPPDYIIRLANGNTIGLELTEATDEDYKKEEHQKAREPEAEQFDLEGADGAIYLDSQKAPKVDRSLVYKKNAEAIFDAITRKTKCLERIRIKNCSETHLGIWPNMPLANWLNSEKALNIVEKHLSEVLQNELFRGFFDRIFILQNPNERQYLFCFERFKFTYRAIPLRSAFNA